MITHVSRATGPFYVTLRTLDKDGGGEDIRDFHRMYVMRTVRHRWWLLRWTTTERFYTEGRDGFFARCIERAQMYSNEFGRPVHLRFVCYANTAAQCFETLWKSSNVGYE